MLWNTVNRGSDIIARHSLTIPAEVIATGKATFMERRNMEQVAKDLKGSLVSTKRTRLMSYWGVIC